MPDVYELCADEAWTHGGLPLNRYWCFFGGVFGSESDIDRLEQNLKSDRVFFSSGNREIKWTNLNNDNIDDYAFILDQFFDYMNRYDIIYRQMFLDRMFVYEGNPISDIDLQYKLYYQYIKHHFGFQYLPRSSDASIHIRLRLDTHSSQDHRGQLTKFLVSLGPQISRNDISFDPVFVNSSRFLRLQVCDLIMGAAGFYGNRHHKRRASGQRGMSSKQKLRLRLAKYIYGKLRDIHNSDRSTNSFNWFENTGHDGSKENRLTHKIRIWKFIPSNYRIDHGWKNSSLSSSGEYIRKDISKEVYTLGY